MIYMDLGEKAAGEFWIREAIRLAPTKYYSQWAAVYLEIHTGTPEDIEAAARAAYAVSPDEGLALMQLRDTSTSFEDAGQYGERFLYGLNYVDRSRILVESHLGADMTASIFDIDPAASGWSGPFRSEHGSHVVLVSAVEPGRDPKLEEVRVQVEQQASRALSERRAREAAQLIVDAYDVEILYDPNTAVN